MQESAVPRNFNPEPYAYHQVVTVEVVSLANNGCGIARDGNWVIFVPFALPGDVVEVKVWRNGKTYSEADLVKVVRPSPDRVEPKCVLFGTCGGCQYQNLEYSKQLEWKTRQVAELLKLQAGLDVDVEPAIASPQIYAYRSKITPHFHKPKNGKMGEIGFLKAGARQALVDVPQCPIAMESINAALPSVRQDARDNAKQYKKGATLLLRAGKDGVETNPRMVVEEEVGETLFRFLAGDFFQNNPYILPEFTGYVAREARDGEHRYLVDAYCGSGLFALTLAPHFERVAGVEVSETAADWAQGNARANGLENVSFLAASAEAIFGQIDFPPKETAVVIDPPRKGCDKQFLDQLFAFGPDRVVYVSCNPATQIRDLQEFQAAGYRVSRVQPFDLFPHTKHLECVATLEKI